MTHTPDTPRRRDEKAAVLAGEQVVRAKDLRRFKWETRILYCVAVALAVVSGVLYDRLVDVSDRTISSLRVGCEGVNALRVNQALATEEQIEQTERSLRGSLGSLEPFRAQIVEGVRLRRERLSRLQATVAAHPLTGDAALRFPAEERPYRADCADAFPR